MVKQAAIGWYSAKNLKLEHSAKLIEPKNYVDNV